jgi:hypothetical protein
MPSLLELAVNRMHLQEIEAFLAQRWPLKQNLCKKAQLLG